SAPRRIPPPCSINFRVVVVITLSCLVPSGTARNSRPRVKRRSIIAGGVPPPIPASPASLLQQPHGEDLHSPVDSLHHVVDGEQRDGYRRQRLHLHARPSHGLVGDVHHASPARGVEVRQLHRGDPRSSPSTAATSCGFTLPCASSRASSTRAMAETTFADSFPARASLRNRASSSSSIAVSAPRAWNGWRPSARLRRPTGPLRTACRNRSAPS